MNPWVKNLVPVYLLKAIKIGKKSLICKESPPRMRRSAGKSKLGKDREEEEGKGQ